jgi:hypothetical protein
MSLVNGDLSAARTAVAEQVKFDILTATQEIVRAQSPCRMLAHGYHMVRIMRKHAMKSLAVLSVRVPSLDINLELTQLSADTITGRCWTFVLVQPYLDAVLQSLPRRCTLTPLWLLSATMCTMNHLRLHLRLTWQN